MKARFPESVSVILILASSLSVHAWGAIKNEPKFSGLVPFTESSLALFKNNYRNITETSVDGSYAVYEVASCANRISHGRAVGLATAAIERFPSRVGGATVQVTVREEAQTKHYRVFGTMTFFCPADASEPPNSVVMIRKTFEEWAWYKAYIADEAGDTVDQVPREWSDSQEQPEYVGFLSQDGKAWAFALLANGERLIVFDLRGSLLLDQKSWGYTHLIRENNDVVLYTILIDKAPASALDQMPGKDELHKRLALGAWRLWTLRRISKNTNEVLASALVPASRGPHDANPEIERRSAPLVEKARALFAGFRKEGRIVDSLP